MVPRTSQGWSTPRKANSSMIGAATTVAMKLKTQFTGRACSLSKRSTGCGCGAIQCVTRANSAKVRGVTASQPR
jgi:hypothetical protein